MGLAEFRQKFVDVHCPVRSACRATADRKFFGLLFETEWEVFVIKKDERTGKFGWTVLCCEAAQVNIGHESKPNAAACC